MVSKRQNAYLESINRAIDYIADNLEEPLRLDRLAGVAGFSPFYFHRIFKSLTGESVHELTKRLRLEKAVSLRKYSPHLTLTEIAFRCGFNSSADFSRSFKARYGIRPSKFDAARFRRNRKFCKALESWAEYHVRRLPEMERGARHRVTVERLPELNVAYLRVTDSYRRGRVRKAFDRMMEWAHRGGFDRNGSLIGMSQDDPYITPLPKCRYDVCYTVPPGTRGDGEISVRCIPASRYAVLHINGDGYSLVHGWDYLFKRWLPQSSWRPTNAPALEWYVRTPAFVGWEWFDLKACVPVRPL